ncbi:MAG: PEP-CTERM sorting domain-containing protein [Pirellulales bacterium]
MLVTQNMDVRGTAVRRLTRLASIASVSALVLIMCFDQLHAASVPVYFNGTEQTFNATVDLTGDLTATGTGEFYNQVTKVNESFTLTPPTSHPLQIDGGPLTLATQPASAGYATFDVTGGHATSAAGLNLNLLNGTTTDFTLSPINVTTSTNNVLLKNVEIGLTGTLSSLVFQQTGGATFNPTGVGTGTFEIAGNAAAALLNINASALGAVNVPVVPQYSSTPLTLSGTYTITGDDANPKIELDGALGLGLPLNLASALTAALDAPLALSIDAALGLAATVSASIAFHLEQSAIYVPPGGTTGANAPANFKFGSLLSFDAAGQPFFEPIVPEPGSAVLLLLGLAAAAPLLVKRWRGRGRG